MTEYPKQGIFIPYLGIIEIQAMQIMERVKLIESFDDLDSIWNEFGLLAKQLGFDYVIYTISNNNSDDFYYYDNFGLHPQNGEKFYDPFLDYCCHSYDTMYTGPEFLHLHGDLNMPPKAYELIERGTKLGMIAGVAIPLRLSGSNRYGGFNLGSGLTRAKFEALCDKSLGAAQVACMLVHRHIERVLDQNNILMEQPDSSVKIEPAQTTPTQNQSKDKLQVLTPREQDILGKIANGYSRKKCADSLCLSESTVSTHMKNIYQKLGVHNRVQATNILLQRHAH